jgi:RNA polymerase sigma-70 factor (ECF subfamily)
VDGTDWSAASFETHRPHLRAVAYRMLGSLSEAEDAVQEAWLRLSRSGTDDIENLRAWLTTVVSRVCLDMLRARAARREESLEVHVPDPVVTAIDDDPEEHALLADSVGLALLVVLDTLSPTERLAFVLHDIFAIPFDQVGAILDRSPAAAKQLASRARQRLRGAGEPETADRARQRQLIEAFDAAARGGDIADLLNVLAPDVVLRADAGAGPLGPSRLISGAEEVAAQALLFSHMAKFAYQVLINGTPGFLVSPNGKPFALISITTQGSKITEINILADPDRLSRLDLPLPSASMSGVAAPDA